MFLPPSLLFDLFEELPLMKITISRQETSDLEELVIHILVEDIPQDEVARLCQTPDQHEAIKQVYRELPNITKSIGSFILKIHSSASMGA